MVSTGLATIASCNYDLLSTIHGKKTMNILCIGHGGGSLPLFLASKIQGWDGSLTFSVCGFLKSYQSMTRKKMHCNRAVVTNHCFQIENSMLVSGAVVHIVEIDPLVISASVQAMGFPSFSVMTTSGDRALSKPDTINEVLWKGIHERLNLYESDAENFILENNNLYDMVFIDAYDGDDIFPRKLWDPDSPFVKALSDQLHPQHGTVVVNLHSDSEILNSVQPGSFFYPQLQPMGNYVSRIGRAYKDVLLGSGSSDLAYIVSVPWVCNSTLVVCRALGMGGRYYDRDLVLNTLITKSLEIEFVLNLPFPCFQYIKRDFMLID